MPPWFDSHYDPRTRRIVLVGDPPPYVLAHESAHAAQHGEHTLLFTLWRCARWLPRLGPAIHVLLELDAHLRARSALRAAGHWSVATQRDAASVLDSILDHWQSSASAPQS